MGAVVLVLSEYAGVVFLLHPIRNTKHKKKKKRVLRICMDIVFLNPAIMLPKFIYQALLPGIGALPFYNDCVHYQSILPVLPVNTEQFFCYSWV